MMFAVCGIMAALCRRHKDKQKKQERKLAMKKHLKLMACVVMAAMCTGAFAKDESDGVWLPIGLYIIAPPVQLPSPSHTVFGGMVNLGYGQMTDVAIFDVGLINNVTRSMVGLEVGPVNLADSCYGAQVGVVNFTGDLHGLQLGVLNFSSSGGALIFPIINFGF